MGGYGRRHRGGRFGMSYASQHQMMVGADEDGGAYEMEEHSEECKFCLLYTSPSPRDATLSRMPSSA